jgi:hypothetical protein
LLASGDSCAFLLLPLNGKTVRRVDEPTMDSDWIAARGFWKSAPTPYSFVVQTDDGFLAVPATAIASGGSKPYSGSGSGGGGGGGVAAGVILGVLVGAVLAYAAIGAAMASAFSHALI